MKPSKASRGNGWYFIAPGLLFHILAVTIPAVMVLYLPFTRWNGISPPHFIGLANFHEMIRDSVVLTSFLNNVKWAVFWLTIPLITALVLALLLTKIKRGQTLYQAIFFSTSVVTATVAGQIWLWLYDPFSGVDHYLQNAGLGFLSWPGLTIPALALFSILIVDMWKSFGGNVIWLLAATTQLDKSLEESARIDGAGRTRIVWSVILPQLRPTLVILAMLTILSSFGAFEMVFVMTQGGPAHVTETISTYTYHLSTTARRAGYSSAINLLQIGIAFILIACYAALRKKKGWEV